MAIQPDGKIVVAGCSDAHVAVVRYNPDGALDATFNGVGKVTTATRNGNDYCYGVAVQADRKIVVAGTSSNGSNSDFLLLRYNANGTLDTSFNGAGIVTTDFDNSDDGALGVAIQADGKIVVVGYSKRKSPHGEHISRGTFISGADFDFAVARYSVNGTLDTSFNGTGKVTTSFGSNCDIGQSVAVQSDGKIVVAGYSVTGSYHEHFALVRYNVNGTLDISFNGTGKVITNFGADKDSAKSVVIQNNGKIVVAGYSLNSNGSHDFALARYNANGTLDPSLNGTGKVTTSFGVLGTDAYGVAMQIDGKIVVAGHCSGPPGIRNSDFAVVRYDADGNLDTSFNGSGEVTTDFDGYDDGGQGVAIQADGKIVVVGYSVSNNRQHFAVVRYNSNGTLDMSFNGAAK